MIRLTAPLNHGGDIIHAGTPINLGEAMEKKMIKAGTGEPIEKQVEEIKPIDDKTKEDANSQTSENLAPEIPEAAPETPKVEIPEAPATPAENTTPGRVKK